MKKSAEAFAKRHRTFSVQKTVLVYSLKEKIWLESLQCRRFRP